MEKNKKKNIQKNYPVAMTIAGSDSGGGAGIQADLRTFNAFGVFGCSAITAVTSQNPKLISRVDTLPADAVTAQIDAIASTMDVTWAKTGMLANREIVSAVANAVKKHDLKLVCDPVMVSTSGFKLLEDDAIRAMTDELLPMASWITPNIPEAELLLDRKLDSTADMHRAAEELSEKFNASILLKGGHRAPDSNSAKLAKACDTVFCKGRLFELSSFYAAIPKYASHGTGCTLSAALAACFALESPWKEALCVSKAFVLGSLIESVEIGNGLHAMYPPTGEYMSSVAIEEIS